MSPELYSSLRTLAKQVEILERFALGLQNQQRAFLEDGWVPASLPAITAAGDALMLERDRLVRQMWKMAKGTELRMFAEATKGLGPAVVLCAVSMPPLSDFSTVSKVWKYCGLSVGADGRGARKRRLAKDEKLGYSPRLQSYSIIRLAEPCVKCSAGPYRKVYLRRREHTAITHPDWTKGHSHADARRVTAKAILRDMWRVSHGQLPLLDAQTLNDAHTSVVLQLVA